ncbi:uncharacterized protein BJ212DRAFT_1581291, partial [Suillus subaureus]
MLDELMIVGEDIDVCSSMFSMAGEGGSSLWNNSAFSGSYTPSPGPSLANMTSPEADSFSPPPVQVPQPQFSLFQQGAYMHENQALRERCGILEAQVTKLSIERDTIQAMFHQLASSVCLDEAVESLGSKGTHLSLAAPCTSNTKQPTRETHPKVKFWNQDAFLDWAERASAQGLHRGKIPYLEGENGEPVPEATVKAIRKTLRGGWSELVNRQLAPKSRGSSCTRRYRYMDQSCLRRTTLLDSAPSDPAPSDICISYNVFECFRAAVRTCHVFKPLFVCLSFFVPPFVPPLLQCLILFEHICAHF